MRSRTAAIGLLAAAVVVGGCSRGSKKTSTAAPASAPTSTAPTSAAAPASTTTTMPVFTAEGAFMTPPAQATVKPYDPDPQCQSLIDAGFTGTCAQTTTPSGTVAVVSEQQVDGGPRPGATGGESRELLYHRDGDHLGLALRYSAQVSQSTGSLDASQLADVAADGDNKAVFVLHDAGDENSSAYTVKALDVAEATGKVVLHLSLDHGVARTATGGGVESWSRVAGTSPLQYRHLVVRFHGGAWRAEVDERVPAEAVPRPDAKNSTGLF